MTAVYWRNYNCNQSQKG